MWKPDLCIYHGNCDDGFGAAWAIWMKWGNDVAYVPATYGKPCPISPESMCCLLIFRPNTT